MMGSVLVKYVLVGIIVAPLPQPVGTNYKGRPQIIMTIGHIKYILNKAAKNQPDHIKRGITIPKCCILATKNHSDHIKSPKNKKQKSIK